MTTRPESARTQNAIHNSSAKIRKDAAYMRIVYELRLRDVLVTYAKSTR